VAKKDSIAENIKRQSAALQRHSVAFRDVQRQTVAFKRHLVAFLSQLKNKKMNIIKELIFFKSTRVFLPPNATICLRIATECHLLCTIKMCLKQKFTKALFLQDFFASPKRASGVRLRFENALSNL
jgi:hypothetical protein